MMALRHNINTKEYWDGAWKKEENGRFYDKLFYYILSLIPSNSSIIDIGCGPGTLINFIYNNKENVSVTGLDFSEVAINNVRNMGYNGIVCDINILDIKEHYDIAICTEVLEHIENDKLLLSRLFSIANKIIISVPNNVLGPNEEKEHLRKYTGQTLKKLFGKNCYVEINEVGPHLVAVASIYPFDIKTKVYVAILNQGYIRPELSNLLIYMTHDPRYKIKITYPNDQPVASNRNKIVKNFLNGDWDYLLMIDSDVVPSNNPLNLIQYNKDIIAYPCPQWNNGDLYWVVMDQVKGGYKPIPSQRRNGMTQVDAVGTGCILINRKVLDRVKTPFDMKYKSGILDLGEDFYFCEKSKKLGFEVWIDWNYPCSHFKEINLIEILKLLNG